MKLNFQVYKNGLSFGKSICWEKDEYSFLQFDFCLDIQVGHSKRNSLFDSALED